MHVSPCDCGKGDVLIGLSAVRRHVVANVRGGVVAASQLRGSGKCSAALCTSVTATTLPDALVEIETAERLGADIVELRMDCITDLEKDPPTILEAVMKKCKKPFIVTCRPVWEG